MIKKYLDKLIDIKNCIKKENGIYRLNSRYKIGKIILQGTTASLKIENSSQKIFIPMENLNGAYNNDIVVAQVIFNPKGKTKAKVIKVLEAGNNTILCFIHDNKLFTIKENILLHSDKINGKDGDIVIVKNNHILELFGNINDPEIDEKISLFLYNEYYRINTQTKISKFNSSDYQTRKDLRDLPFATIDPVGAKDYDDAIYFDETTKELYVAIADVSAFVKENDNIDKEAKKRSFSIYLPHKVLPMLPFELSNNLCSLVPNQDRLAYVFKMKLDLKTMKVVSSDLFEATINSKNRYTYEEIDQILNINDNTNKYVKLYNITKKFRHKRLQKGYDFRNDEIRLKLDNKQSLYNTTIESSTPSHSLIEECMLLVNQEAAKRIKSTGIFRVHEAPTNTKIAKLIEDINALGIKAKLKDDFHTTILSIQDKAKNVGLENEVDELIIQSQQQARYSSTKQEHFGLGFSDYSHFTSPIRRYADLIVHRILKTKQIPKDIEDIATNISEQERSIASLVWDFEDRKYARWAKEHIGETLNAKVIDTQKGIVKTYNPINGLRIEIENYSAEKLFTNLKVEITDVNLFSKKVIGKILG